MALLQKRPSLINRKDVIPQRDNARLNSARITQEKKIKGLNWEVLSDSVHSPAAPQITIFLNLWNIFFVEKNFLL